ncbi:MAG: AAA family ATPase [Spirochaetia bacterium]
MKKAPRELTVDEVSIQLSSETIEKLKKETHEFEIIGQPRAVKALEMGLDLHAHGYNIFVTGLAGTGKRTAIKKMLAKMQQDTSRLKDIVFVYNFDSPESPKVLYFDPGKGKQFKRSIHQLVENLKGIVKKRLEDPAYKKRRDELVAGMETRENNRIAEFEEILKQAGFQIVQVGEEGSQTTDIVPLIKGEPVSFEALSNLVQNGQMEEEEWNSMRKAYFSYMDQLKQVFHEIQIDRNTMQEGIQELQIQTISPAVQQETQIIKQNFPGSKVEQYLSALTEDIKEHLFIFLKEEEVKDQQGNPALIRYGVNVLVDHANTGKVPIIFENHPNQTNLFGTIETLTESNGETRTSFMMIRAGSVIRASGGVLILQAEDLFQDEELWLGLKKALKSSRVEIQQPTGPFNIQSNLLKPDPVKINTKVIVVGTEHMYDALYNQDEDFQKLFKVPAEFDHIMVRDNRTSSEYIQFILKKIHDENRKFITNDGIAAVIEQGVRIAENRDKLSTRFSLIADIIREADYWAGKLDKTKIDSEAVEKALTERKYLYNLWEAKLEEQIIDKSLLIEVTGSAVGKVNGLAIHDRGYFAFGSPALITAQTGPGEEGIINIEREVGLSGEIHDKGVMIIEGFLRSIFAQKSPLSILASICFEQNYFEVDGDSASSSEFYALLSSLARVPIRQDIAVTGSVNQMGEIQPVGGITEKVEGFYEICKKYNYTGTQGVIIPEQNIRNLVLNREVQKAVKEGSFHIFPVKSVLEGIEILTGISAGKPDNKGRYPSGSINGRITKRLKEIERLKKEHGSHS